MQPPKGVFRKWADMGILSVRRNSKIFVIDWRLLWYSALIWLLVVLSSGFVVIPWYFFVLPLAVLVTTVLYFKTPDNEKYRRMFNRETLFAQGLWVGTIWFSGILLLDFIEFISFDMQNFYVYLMDSRNFLKFPVVILVPVIYGLLLEQTKKGKKKFLLPEDIEVGVSA